MRAQVQGNSDSSLSEIEGAARAAAGVSGAGRRQDRDDALNLALAAAQDGSVHNLAQGERHPLGSLRVPVPHGNSIEEADVRGYGVGVEDATDGGRTATCQLAGLIVSWFHSSIDAVPVLPERCQISGSSTMWRTTCCSSLATCSMVS